MKCAPFYDKIRSVRRISFESSVQHASVVWTFIFLYKRARNSAKLEWKTQSKSTELQINISLNCAQGKQNF